MTPTEQRRKALEKTPKYQLASMHAANGGLMGVTTYLQWTKDELVNAVLEDEGYRPWQGVS